MQTQLIPALDLIDGKVVRLFKGDYAQMQSYPFSPLEKAKEYENSGAKCLHIVDLDGAKNPARRQISLVKSICKQSKIAVQVGGGIRTRADVKELLDAGARRVIIGSLAIRDPKACVQILREFDFDEIVIALDVKPKGDDYIVLSNAWQSESDQPLLKVAEFYAENGARHFICTDVTRDGTMSGANAGLYKLLSRIFTHAQGQASGGVNSLADLAALKGLCAGVIVGKALLDGKFSVAEAIKCLQNA